MVDGFIEESVLGTENGDRDGVSNCNKACQYDVAYKQNVAG